MGRVLIVWTLIGRLDHVYRDIAYTVYLLDVLEESHTAQLLLDYLLLHEVSECSEGVGVEVFIHLWFCQNFLFFSCFFSSATKVSGR